MAVINFWIGNEKHTDISGYTHKGVALLLDLLDKDIVEYKDFTNVQLNSDEKVSRQLMLNKFDLVRSKIELVLNQKQMGV